MTADRFTLDEADCALRLAGPDRRAEAMVALWPLMDPADWFEVVAWWWTDADDCGRHWPALRKILTGQPRDRLDKMMLPAEREAFAALPEEIVVFRGCRLVNLEGLSWSLDPEIAAQVAFWPAYSSGQPAVLLAGTVRREHAVLKLMRSEAEIISTEVKALAVVPVWPSATPPDDLTAATVVRSALAALERQSAA